MHFESLIFDIDGTLWDSRALVAEGYNLQLRDEGLEHLYTDAETLKGLFGNLGLTKLVELNNPLVEAMRAGGLPQADEVASFDAEYRATLGVLAGI